MAELHSGALVTVAPATAAEREAWNTLIAIGGRRNSSAYVLIGGQMVMLHTAFAEVKKPSATDDMDVLVDLRVHPNGLADIAMCLNQMAYAAQGPDVDGIQHRWVKTINDGTAAGDVTFDVLAPDHLGGRADLTTARGGRTVATPGGSFAIETALEVAVRVQGANDLAAEQTDGRNVRTTVRVPALAGALVLKARATLIAGRATERDFEDAAALLACIEDPIAFASVFPSSQLKHLHHLLPLRDAAHPGWRAFDATDARNGRAALGFLLPS